MLHIESAVEISLLVLPYVSLAVRNATDPFLDVLV